ncbi:hypothetical protein [Streptomyces flaveolus]|uniref:hypothetical protein n=1 Tax=Streptomyces flaveolus TaxID=67297 RepID=UPI0037FD3B1E
MVTATTWAAKCPYLPFVVIPTRLECCGQPPIADRALCFKASFSGVGEAHPYPPTIDRRM